ncbi:MAG: hypothetical protein GQE15_35220 [Archangiaceae bacterium]|nr:hypothetical protein [Archangiaceae bacterium]
MSDVRIALEGRLEQLEASVVFMRQVRALVDKRGVARAALEQVDLCLRTIAATVPATRRFSTSPEVVAAFESAGAEMTQLLRAARRLCRHLDVPLPRTVLEVRAALAPHLPIHLSTTLAGTRTENVGALLIPALLVGAAAVLPAGAPVLLVVALVLLGVSFVHGTKRVVVSATRLRLGPRSWALDDIRRIVIDGPSMVVAIETTHGTTCEVLLPGAIDPLLAALRACRVPVSVQLRAEETS